MGFKVSNYPVTFTDETSLSITIHAEAPNTSAASTYKKIQNEKDRMKKNKYNEKYALDVVIMQSFVSSYHLPC